VFLTFLFHKGTYKGGSQFELEVVVQAQDLKMIETYTAASCRAARMAHRNIRRPWTMVDVNKCESVPCPRFGHTAVVVNNSMVLFGGREAAAYLNDVWDYDFNTRRWRMVKAIDCTSGDTPSPCAGHTAVVSGACMWVFGGQRSASGDDCSGDLWSLDVSTNEWQRLRTSSQDWPAARKGHTAVVAGGQMLIFGGSGAVNDRSVWFYDFSRKRWALKATTGPRPSSRLYHVAEVTGDQRTMLVFGGRNPSNDQFYNDLHAFDVQSACWRSITCSGDIPSSRMCSASVFHNGVLCVFFGGSPEEYLGDSYEFDVTTNTWRRLSMEGTLQPCTRPTTVVHQNRITIFGGCSEQSCLNDTLEMDFEAPTLRELCREWLLQRVGRPNIHELCQQSGVCSSVASYIVARD